MHKLKIKRASALVVLLAIAAFSATSLPAVHAVAHDNSPDLPSPLCDSIDVPVGNKVSHHAYAQGVQMYRWNGTTWAFVEPVATLFSDPEYHGKVGTHYLGPTWESNNGSKVLAARVPNTGCTPDASAIPWLLLQTVSTDGPGPFSSVTFIQRVNTKGGLAPTGPGSLIGTVAEVPYTAEYYFYRAKNN